LNNKTLQFFLFNSVSVSISGNVPGCSLRRTGIF